jgi:NADH:ubiquinone oxidoreductase subunit
MGFLSKIFTWWDGATVGTMLFSARHGEHVGTDAQGNTYYRAKKKIAAGEPFAGTERRWVIYAGANDASRVPAEWHGWLHGNVAGVPESHMPPARIWETEFTPNETGTATAYRPQGALERGGQRAPVVRDELQHPHAPREPLPAERVRALQEPLARAREVLVERGGVRLLVGNSQDGVHGPGGSLQRFPAAACTGPTGRVKDLHL